MGKRYNHYHVKIDFDKSRIECAVGNKYAKYISGQEYLDSFHFLPDSFTLIASRGKSFEDGSILSNSVNSLNSQLLKGLLFYCSLANDYPKITNVSIVRKRAKGKDFEYTESKSNIVQPLIGSGNKIYSLNKEKLEVIFEETEKGNAIRIALSYWLKGMASQDRYYKFDHFWRAFNRLFMYQGNQSKEFDCMVKMREFIISNEDLFPNTISITNSYNRDVLRSFRWRNFILNDFDTVNKTKSFYSFIKRYHDIRIMSLLNEILPYREKYLTQENYIVDVRKHIASNVDTCDPELITLLAIKYAYYIRNKMFHGEIPDSTFKVHDNNVDIEIDRLNNVLSSLINELINSNDIMR